MTTGDPIPCPKCGVIHLVGWEKCVGSVHPYANNYPAPAQDEKATKDELVRIMQVALKPFARAYRSIPSDDPGPFHLQTLTGYRIVTRGDLEAVYEAYLKAGGL